MAAAMAITGKGKRRLQLMAKARKVPGAAKIWGEWTFDEQKLRAWVKTLEDESCPIEPTPAAAVPSPAAAAARRPLTPSGAATRSMGANASRESSSDGRYEQAKSRLLAYGSRRTSRG